MREGEMSQSELEDKIAQYEKLFGMSSAEFLQQQKEGTTPDTFEAMAWAVLLRHCINPD